MLCCGHTFVIIFVLVCLLVIYYLIGLGWVGHDHGSILEFGLVINAIFL